MLDEQSHEKMTEAPYADSGSAYRDPDSQKPQTTKSKKPRDLAILAFLGASSAYYFTLTQFLESEQSSKVIASRIPVLQTMAGVFAELSFCLLAAIPLKFLRPKLVSQGQKISTLFMIALAGIAFLQELVFYYGVSTLLPSSGFLSRVFVLPIIVLLLKTFVDRVFSCAQIVAQIFVLLAVAISFTASNGWSSFQTLPVILLLISALCYGVQVSIENALFKIDYQLSTVYMMGIVAFWKCVFALFALPALKLFETGEHVQLLPDGSLYWFLSAALAQAASTWFGLLVVRFEETAITRILACIVTVLLAEQIVLADDQPRETGYGGMIPPNLLKGVAFLMSSIGTLLYVCVDRGNEEVAERRQNRSDRMRRSQQGRSAPPEGYEAGYSGFYSVDYDSPVEEENQRLIDQQAQQNSYLPAFREEPDITLH